MGHSIELCLFLVIITITIAGSHAHILGWYPSSLTAGDPDVKPMAIPQRYLDPDTGLFEGSYLFNELNYLIPWEVEQADSTTAAYTHWKHRHADLYDGLDESDDKRLHLDALYLALATLAVTNVTTTRMGVPIIVPITDGGDTFFEDFPGLWADYHLDVVLMNLHGLDWDLYMDIMHDELDRHKHWEHIRAPMEAYLTTIKSRGPPANLADQYRFFTAYIKVDVWIEPGEDGAPDMRASRKLPEIMDVEVLLWLTDVSQEYHDHPAVQRNVYQCTNDRDTAAGYRECVRGNRFHSSLEDGSAWSWLASMGTNEPHHDSIIYMRDTRVL